MTAAELGLLAVDMQRARLVVEEWLRSEGEKGNLRTADQCPHWPEYQALSEKFFTELRQAEQDERK